MIYPCFAHILLCSYTPDQSESSHLENNLSLTISQHYMTTLQQDYSNVDIKYSHAE